MDLVQCVHAPAQPLFQLGTPFLGNIRDNRNGFGHRTGQGGRVRARRQEGRARGLRAGDDLDFESPTLVNTSRSMLV